jgi:imidazolonepropionase-like amidohydrolase
LRKDLPRGDRDVHAEGALNTRARAAEPPDEAVNMPTQRFSLPRMSLNAARSVAMVCAATVCLAAQPSNIIDLKGATVIDMTGRAPFIADVVLRNDRIATIGRNAPVPAGATVLDVTGDYIVPGFTDMHAHVTFLRDGTLSRYDRATSEQVLRLLLAYGVTTVRNPAAPAVDGVALREDVARGAIPGPRIFTAGEALNGRPFSTSAQIRAEIDRQAGVGVNAIKVYADSTPPQTAVAIDEAHRRGLKVIGHLQATDWPTAASQGIDFVTHAVSWSDTALPPQARAAYRAEQRRVGPMKARILWLESVDVNGPEIGRVIDALKAHHISDDPTLIAYKTKFVVTAEYRGEQNVSLAPQAMQRSWRTGGSTADWTSDDYERMRRVWPKMLAIVYRYFREGVTLTTGTDVPNPWVVPGVSLHQEMALLSDAGIPNEAILAMTTRNAAAALGLDREIGTLEVGKRADVVVLGANPLADIHNTRQIREVFAGGVRVRQTPVIPPRK